MAKLSSAAWVAHDLGLATAVGGTLFGRQALTPALAEVESGAERARVADTAWRRFSWINLAAHGVVAATWFAGRSMLTGREVSRTSRRLTLVKDGLVIAGLVSGITSVILGRVLGARTADDRHIAAPAEERRDRTLRTVVGAFGTINMLTMAAVGAVTTALSMEASHSLPFSVISRRLP